MAPIELLAGTTYREDDGSKFKALGALFSLRSLIAPGSFELRHAVVEPVSAACIWMVAQVAASATIGNALTGIVGNRADGIFCNVAGRVGGALADALGQPENHDLLKGIILAYRQSLSHVAHTARTQARDYGERQLADQMVALARKATESDSAVAAVVAGELMPTLNPLISGPLAGASVDRREAILEMAAERTIALFESNCGPLPSHFRSLFRRSAPNGANSWEAEFRIHVSETIKKDHRFEAILNASNIAELVGHAIVLEEIATQMATDLDRLKSGQAEHTLRFDKQSEQLSELLSIARRSGIFERAAEQGIPEAPVRAIVERLGGEGIAKQDLIGWLESWVDAASRELGRRSNEGEAFEAARQEAQKRFLQGDRRDLSEPFMKLLEYEEALERQQAAESRRRRASLIEEAIRFDLLALDVEGAVAKLQRLATLEGAIGSDVRADWFAERATAEFIRALEMGDNAALLLAMALRRLILDLIPREKQPVAWAVVQRTLGDDLRLLGERQAGTSLLREAISAYEVALEELSQEESPQQWAGTQSELGVALMDLGERLRSESYLREAIVAFENALDGLTTNETSSYRAFTQNRLANAFQILGRWERSSEKLRKAVSIYHEALKITTKEHNEMEWAAIQNNLGNTLRILGDTEADADHHRDAVSAYHAALEVRTQEKSPQRWAMTQYNLAVALHCLGVLKESPADLENAVSAYRLSLQERTRERTAQGWALTHMGLGATQYALAGLRDSSELLEEAARSYGFALEEWTRERQPLDWVEATAAKALIDGELALRRVDRDRLIAAIASARGTLDEVPNDPSLKQYVDTVLASLTHFESIMPAHP